MEQLVARTHESSSVAQLDGSDIVYVARVAVPKIVTLAVTIGTRFPAVQTSLGKVLLAALPPGEAERFLAEPTRSGITARWQPAAETPIEVLTGEYLPLLLQTASAISADWAACQAAPQMVSPPARVSRRSAGLSPA